MEENIRFDEFIREVNLRRLVLPICYIIFLGIIYVLFSVNNWVFPSKYTQTDDFDRVYEEESSRYVSCTVNHLMYTGIVHKNNKKVDGYYYYTLKDGVCRFYLLSDKRTTGKPVIEQYTFNARIVDDAEILEDIETIMAEQLSFTKQGVEEISSRYIISEVGYIKWHIYITALLMLITFIAAIVHIIILVMGIINPYNTVDLWYISDSKERKELVEQANKEYEEDLYFASQEMYITENYFIYLGKDTFGVILLDDITWAYKHSHLNTIGLLFTKGHVITYNLRLVTIFDRTYTYSGKNKESCDGLLEVMSARRQDILIGYSTENKVKFND